MRSAGDGLCEFWIKDAASGHMCDCDSAASYWYTFSLIHEPEVRPSSEGNYLRLCIVHTAQMRRRAAQHRQLDRGYPVVDGHTFATFADQEDWSPVQCRLAMLVDRGLLDF